MRLDGKRILVTGTGSGFGAAMARRFCAEGARVAALDVDMDANDTVVADINTTHGGSQADGYQCDVADPVQVAATVAACIDAMSGLDVVVNNAGWSHRNQPLLDVTAEEFRKVYEVNVFSIHHMVRAILPHWRRSGSGVMINITSTAGIRPRPGLTWYNSTKGAVNTLTKSLAAELASDNIRVCGIAPVMGTTGLLETFMGGPETPERRAQFLATIPLGRFSHPDDIASAAVFLASDEARMITGAILEVDGGRCI
ncbi:MAG: SDR family oxidoreductase [Rhodobacteraceae bacterium]|nr:SDR family oxidoreductase [Paracoccaceae bacterium]